MESMVWTKIEERRLSSGADWETVGSTIKAMTFGVLFEIASERVKHYMSDLFHDAVWLESYLTGPIQFEWLVRESGTFIGDVVESMGLTSWEESAKYRFRIIERDRAWSLMIWQGGPLPTDPDPQIVLPGESLHQTETDPVLRSLLRRRQGTGDTEAGSYDYGQDEPSLNEIADCETGSSEVVNEDPLMEILSNVFPSDGNEIEEPKAPARRERTAMEEYIREQREKLQEANAFKEELRTKRSAIETAENEIDGFIDEMETFIDSLESAPSVSIDIDLDSMAFESDS